MEAVERSEISSQEILNAESCEKHLSLQEKSGLSRRKYCADNKINYSRFLYWAKKVSLGGTPVSDDAIPLIAVKLKNNGESLASSESICTLNLKNGCLLKIHTVQALSFILERMG